MTTKIKQSYRISERETPELLALNRILEEDKEIDVLLLDAMTLFHLLTVVYRCSRNGIHTPDIDIDWAYEEVLISVRHNHHLCLENIRNNLLEIKFAPIRWAIYFGCLDCGFRPDGILYVDCE